MNFEDLLKANGINSNERKSAEMERIEALEQQVNTLTYSLNQLGNGVTEVVKKEDSELPLGDYVNPIPYTSGMVVELGKWYYKDDKDLPKECIKSGLAKSFDDDEYLV